MPVFAYRGLAPNGRTINGVIDADSPRSARGKLRELGIFPTELSPEQARLRTSAAQRWMPTFGRRIPATELSLLTRQLSALLGREGLGEPRGEFRHFHHSSHTT